MERDPARRQALLDRYRRGADLVEKAAAELAEGQLDRRPGPGEWTAREVVHHLADAETRSATRLRQLLAEDDPLIVGYDEVRYAERLRYDRPIDRSLAVIRAVREASAELLELLEPAEWERAGTHSESGPYSVDTWLEIYAAHAEEHAEQLRRAGGVR
ncbi:MAG: DinB family protein [Acidimicrobiales bacterium]